MLFWDTASGTSPVQAVEKAHGSCDVHTVDWSGLQDHLVVTGEKGLVGCSDSVSACSQLLLPCIDNVSVCSQLLLCCSDNV